MNFSTFCRRKSKFLESPRIFKGSRQMPWISALFVDKNPNFSRFAILVAACHMIRLFALHCWRSVQQPKHWWSHFLWFTKLLHILFPSSTCCDASTKVLRSRCIQLKFCASRWCTGHKVCVYCIRLACQRCILCVIINTEVKNNMWLCYFLRVSRKSSL